jgi:potassium efflux system protein
MALTEAGLAPAATGPRRSRPPAGKPGATRRWCVPLAALAAAALACSRPAPGQTVPATRPAPVRTTLPTKETIEAHIARLEKAKDLDETVRSKAVEAYKQALAQLKLAADWQAKAAAFAESARTAPARTAQIKAQLSAAASQPAATAPSPGTLEAARALLARMTAELEAARKAAADLQAEPKRRAERRPAIAKLVTAAKQTLADTDKELAAPVKTPTELTAAGRILLETRKQALQQELEAYQKELASYDAERDLLTVRLDLAAGDVSQAEKRQKQIQQVVNRKHKEESERAAQQAAARQRAASADPVLQELANQNARLTSLRTGPDGLAAKIPRVIARVEQVKALLTHLEDSHKSLMAKEKAVGDTALFGVLLRKQRADLPDVRQYRQRAGERQAETARAQLRLIEFREQREALADIDARIQAVVARLDASTPQAERNRIAKSARELLEFQRQALQALTSDYETYFARMIDLGVSVRELVAKTEEVADYVDERVLWIRSAEVLGLQDVPSAAAAARWLLGPGTWSRAAHALWQDAKSHPFVVGAGAAVFLVLLALWRKLVTWLARTGASDAPARAERITPTLVAIVLTLVLALLLPGFLWFVSGRLDAAVESAARAEALAAKTVSQEAAAAEAASARAVSAGLKTVAAILVTFGTLAQIARPKGLAEAHFRVAGEPLASLRKSLRILMVVLAVLGFLTSAMESQANEAWRSSLGRLALVAALVALAIAAQRLLRPAGPVLPRGGATASDDWPHRLRHVWYVLAVGVPLLLAVLAVLGFYYTALHLTGRLAMTLWLTTGLAVLNALALRWVRIAIRRLAIRRSRRRANGEEAGPAADGTGGRPAPDPQAAQRSEVRLDRVNKQMRQLVGSVMAVVLLLGAWGIWSDSLPALAALRRVKLWSYTAKTTTQVTAPDGTTHPQTVETAVPVTLADAGLAVLVVVLTIVAAKSVPALLEIAILQRIQVDAGVRYATSAILKYALAVAGVWAAFGLIGVSWTSIQWLVAAMTVGLAFGLQEIFANFVSGLIILFERPIRIGDTVTIGETAGTVTRIRIRATTITDWDRKELIVPNKEFVTGRLVNWSLSDKVLRVILRVGIAYGSDTDQAERILHQVARQHPLVLNDPKPLVLFSAFGDNSLNFELRVYIGGIEHYLRVWHDLNMAIDKAFREAKITVAFPQRDTHLDTLEPLEIRILPAAQARQRDEKPAAESAD